jgi:hypothetical protein
MKNIHTLPTEKPSRLKQNKITKKYSLVTKGIDLTMYTPQNIYTTSDEEIKEGDWVINLNSPYAHKELCRIDNQLELERYAKKTSNNCKKIILTTDQDLIKDGVQAIDDEFLEWFVKNPSCGDVEIEDISMQYHEEGYYEYKIIIPKEDWLLNNPQCKQIESCSKSLSKKCICPKEEPKQETLEEASDRAYSCGLFSTKTAFIAGAKWQQKQDKKMYSEEEQTDILEVGQILVNEETLEYGLLQYIKICLECNNESQAIRLLEKYGFEKQEERYSEEEIMDMFHSLSMHLPLHYEFLVKEQFKNK